MRVFAFRSAQNHRLFAFTADGTGANLPGMMGPWQTAGASPPVVSELILDVIEARGFFLARPDGMAW